MRRGRTEDSELAGGLRGERTPALRADECEDEEARELASELLREAVIRRRPVGSDGGAVHEEQCAPPQPRE